MKVSVVSLTITNESYPVLYFVTCTNMYWSVLRGVGNSQSCRTLSDKSSECPVKRNWTVYKVYGEQDKSGKNRPKCPAVGSMFPHPWVCYIESFFFLCQHFDNWNFNINYSIEITQLMVHLKSGTTTSSSSSRKR